MTRLQIKKWMLLNIERFIDICGEVDCTGMVEAWDIECDNGKATLDENHIAWEVAIVVKEQVESRS